MEASGLMHHPDPDRRRQVEFHVGKIRNQETGGEPSPLDAPHMFRMTDDSCGFDLIGPFPKLFDCINSSYVEKQLEIVGVV